MKTQRSQNKWVKKYKNFQYKDKKGAWGRAVAISQIVRRRGSQYLQRGSERTRKPQGKCFKEEPESNIAADELELCSNPEHNSFRISHLEQFRRKWEVKK